MFALEVISAIVLLIIAGGGLFILAKIAQGYNH